ncbi:MAG: hypothetical protein MRJ68_16465 [Nitrospira sp.]|nr:hypothetical protein [Nitrospira sp.]
MRDKSWEAEHCGRRIRITNRLSFLPPHTSEVLEVDGVVVKENKGGFLRMFSVLERDVEFAGVKKHVEARIAQKVGSYRTGCHILVDGVLVGGDIGVQLNLPDLEAAKKLYVQGAVRYITRAGLLTYGLPFALLMTLFNAPETVTDTIVTFTTHLVLFGGGMGWFMWQSLKSRVEKVER